MRQDVRIFVEDLTIVESGTYPDQFLRPYVSEVSGSLIDKVEERFAKSKRFTPSILAAIANQFMVPDYHHRGLVEIPNGWNERRGRFVLTLDIEIGTGDHLKQVVIGYTNSVGFTTRSVDHDMEFYINSTFLLTPRTIPTERGYQKVLVPIHTNDVLSDRENAGLRRRGDELYTIRPEDVFSTLDLENTSQLVDDLTDLRTTLSKNSIKSSTANRLGSRYMANVLSARQKALDNSEYGQSATDINATAQGYVQESYTSDDVFLRALSNLRGITATVDNFTFRDLLRIDPEAERRTEPYLLDDLARSTTAYSREATQLDGQEEEDRVAALIAIAVPALMMESCIHSIKFQVHNQGIDQRFTFIPTDAKSFMKNVDMDPFVDQFEERLIDELLYPITGDNRYDIGIELRCRAFGEVDFTLYWDGMARGRYVIPVFCNSLASPIVTNSRDDVQKMSRNFNSLFEEFLPTNLAGGGYQKTGRDYGY